MPRIEGETYFNNFEDTGYEELSSWTPSYYGEIKEADANLQFAGKTVDEMALSLEKWCLNMFIDTMDEEALSRMEVFYYLADNKTKSLSERRRLLKATQLGSGKIGRDRIGRIVESYTGVYPTFEFVHALKIMAGFNDEYVLAQSDLIKIIRKNLPAHIAFLTIFTIQVIINSHDLESISIPSLALKTGIRMWKRVLLDGEYLLDGKVLLSGNQIYFLDPGLEIKYQDPAINEEWGQTIIETFTRDFHYLDGSMLLDGSAMLDSVHGKEIVE